MVGVQIVGDSKSPKVLLATTANGKEIFLVRKPNVSVRLIEFGSGGELPEELRGGFSSVATAKGIAEVYVAKLDKKAAKAAATKASNKEKNSGRTSTK